MPEPLYLIAGCGVSGKAAAHLAARSRYRYALIDENDTPALRDFAALLDPPPEDVIFGWKPGDAIPVADEIIISPGIRKGTAFRNALESIGATLSGELEFALSRLQCPYVGITGTNGKTTVTELTSAIFTAAGMDAPAAGNIGAALSEAVIRTMDHKLDCAVVEISSFQLETLNADPIPAAAAFLNVASDHIDRHATLEEYAAVKCRLLRGCKTPVVVNWNLLPVMEKFLPGKPVITFSATAPDAFYSLRENWICRAGERVLDYSTLQLKGRHNAENVMAALALLESVKGAAALTHPEVLRTLETFRPAAHRVELFWESDGVRYVDDSKATNPHAVNAALDSMAETAGIRLILGGLDKGMDFTELAGHLGKVKKGYVIGACAEKICTALNPLIPVEKYATFEDAVSCACEDARSGETVLLSPACASMDMFRDYKERGDIFKRLVLSRYEQEKKIEKK